MSKGHIIAMGGDIGIQPDTPLFKEFFNKAQKITPGTPTIGIIPTASGTPELSLRGYKDLFESLSSKTLMINPQDREEANSEEVIEKVERCDVYFLTGGQQLRITAVLGGSAAVDKMKEKFEKGALIGGTSAGSVCLSSLMISGENILRPFAHGQVKLTQGLGFIPNVAIDTHFIERGRFPRLIHLVCENPAILGIGIGEGTATIWDFEKNEFKVIGRNAVALVEGKDIEKNNAPELEFGETISVSGVTVDILSKGAKFDLENNEMILPDKTN